MIGIIIATHADLGQELIQAITLILGKQSNLKAIGLKHGDSIETFEQKLIGLFDEIDTGDGVLGFCDFLGGTPANTLMRCMKKKYFPCITGVNMPMLIEALTNRESISAEELKDRCIIIGTNSILSLKNVIEEAEQQNTEEEF